MKRAARIAFILTLLGAAAPSIARAQVTEPMTFTTTFAFTVGRVDFEPGTYVVRPIDDQPNMVCVQGKHGGPAAIVMGVAENPRHKSQVSRVTFVREGNRLVMKSLWEGPESEGLDILPSVVTVNAD